MPSRWLISIAGIDPQMVTPEFVHAAMTRWFDGSDHRATDKPYSLYPRTVDAVGPGWAAGGLEVEVGIVSELAEDRLHEHARPGAAIRLGSQHGTVRQVQLLHAESWGALATWSHADRWRLTFHEPTTWSTRNRTTPLPVPDTIVRNLHRAWRLWSPIPIPPRPQMWASDLSVVSDVISAAERRNRGLPSTLKVVSACKGSIVLRATADSDVAEALLCLAPYTGVGSFTLKGMGVTTVDCMGAPRDMRQMRPLTRPAGA